MKKNCLVMAAVVSLVVSMAGCGDAKKYEKDMDALFEVADFDWMASPEDALEDLDKLEFVTEEGKDLKEGFEEVFEVQLELNELREDLRVSDSQKHLELMMEITEVLDELEEMLVDFYELAERADVDEDELENLEDDFKDFMDEYLALIEFFQY